MSEKTRSVWQFSLQKRTLHKLANIFWGEFKIEYSTRENYSNGEVQTNFRNHLENIADVLEKTKPYLSKLTDQLRCQLRDAILHLAQGYWEAHLWKTIYPFCLPLTLLNSMSEGDYNVGCFIDPNGHFNDLDWVKRFIADDDQFIHKRFELACLYCLEDDITRIWHTMKNKCELPCEGNLEAIQLAYDDLVALWAYKLENELYSQKLSVHIDSFYVLGLKHAISKCYEYAVKYFWAHCFKGEITLIIAHNEFLHNLANIASWKQEGLLNFIYSNLTLKEKISVIFNLNSPKKYWDVAEIWECLIFSSFYESALNDILGFRRHIPSEILENLLTLLSSRIVVESNSVKYREIFTALWNLLFKDQRIKVLELSDDIISNFSGALEIEFLATIIIPLSNYDKERMLIHDWRRAGISALKDFDNVGDSNSIQEYILFFLQDDKELRTQELNLKVNAFRLLDLFKKQVFTYWTKKRISLRLKCNLERIIENLKEHLQISNGIVECSEKI